MTLDLPDSVLYGTALDSSQLDAIARVPETFSYSPASGTIPVAGVDTLLEALTPADTSDYTTQRESTSFSLQPVLASYAPRHTKRPRFSSQTTHRRIGRVAAQVDLNRGEFSESRSSRLNRLDQ